MSEFTKLRHLGKGSYGDVHLIKDKKGKKFVLKIIKNPNITTDWEIQVLKHIKSECKQYLLCFEKFYEKNNEIYLVFKYDKFMYDLYSLRPEHTFNFYLKLKTIEKLLKGLIVLHKLKVVHRDIKPRNILFNVKNGNIKYIDYGLACLEHNENCIINMGGTLDYLPPEPEDYREWESNPFLFTQKRDVFSLGLTIFQICTGVNIGKDDEPYKNIETNLIKASRQYKNKGKLYRSIVKPMLMINWKKRISAKQALTNFYRVLVFYFYKEYEKPLTQEQIVNIISKKAKIALQDYQIPYEAKPWGKTETI